MRAAARLYDRPVLGGQSGDSRRQPHVWAGARSSRFGERGGLALEEPGAWPASRISREPRVHAYRLGTGTKDAKPEEGTVSFKSRQSKVNMSVCDRAHEK